MRIVVLTDESSRHLYFAERIAAGTGAVVGVVLGAKAQQRTLSQRLGRTVRKRAAVARNFVLNHLNGRSLTRLAQEKRAAETQHFAQTARTFIGSRSSLVLARVDATRFGSVNHPQYVDIVRRSEPDVLVVMGTCLIGAPLISAAPVCLNMHTGLSPYYRGSSTNLWPILEEDYGRFGVTVHLMSLGIDSGDIVYSSRIEVQAHDGFPAVNCRAIVAGTEHMISALDLAGRGQLRAVPQWDAGKLYLNNQFNGAVARAYFRKADTYFAEHLRRQQQGKLPPAKVVQAGVVKNG